ncbi:fish-egg lectin-like [Acanthopagrus latus]|uniref:fish-egg lectin-like n=1 Tax=Acanthopagrus latus TaxID=8177 RepID=UPI00187BCFD7|nr:fish-egg lectin-like [Acanthopagrus latus]
MRAVAAFLLVLCYLAVTHAWRCNEGPRLYNVRQIDAGQGKVIARDTYGYVYFLIGSSWHRMSTIRFNHASIGPAGLWATGSSGDKIYKYIAGNFVISSGLLRQLDAGGNGQVVGVSSSSASWCLRSDLASSYKGSGSVSWSNLSRVLKYISCGKYGCWGTDTSHRIYFSQTLSPTTCGNSRWSQISGSAAMAEVGTDGSVFVVNKSGQLYQRLGISSRSPQGTTWTPISMCMPLRHVSYDLGNLWVVTTSGLLMKCTH